MEELRAQYPEIHAACTKSSAGFCYQLDARKTFDVPEAERLAFWENLYTQRGFAKWLGSFADHLKDRDANKAFSDFHAGKIREKVNDPVVAEKLIPKNHGFGTRRVPLNTGYFEVYNRPNVRLVDYGTDSPIERITSKGAVLESGEEIELDVLMYVQLQEELCRDSSLCHIDLVVLTSCFQLCHRLRCHHRGSDKGY